MFSKVKSVIHRVHYASNLVMNYNGSPSTFIHIPKCAGTMVRFTPFLAGRIVPIKHRDLDSVYVKDFKKLMRSLNEHKGIEHARYIDIKPSRRPKKCFAVVRNPWDRVASRYFFAKQLQEADGRYSKKKPTIGSFEEFLEERHIWGKREFMWHRAVRGWYQCTDYVCDENGQIRCDILKFENLNQELQQYFMVSEVGRKRNVSKGKTILSELYTEKTIQIVADWYSHDIEVFGYDFLGGATKNTYYP